MSNESSEVLQPQGFTCSHGSAKAMRRASISTYAELGCLLDHRVHDSARIFLRRQLRVPVANDIGFRDTAKERTTKQSKKRKEKRIYKPRWD
jgi:hypothetical protein